MIFRIIVKMLTPKTLSPCLVDFKNNQKQIDGKDYIYLCFLSDDQLKRAPKPFEIPADIVGARRALRSTAPMPSMVIDDQT